MVGVCSLSGDVGHGPVMRTRQCQVVCLVLCRPAKKLRNSKESF